MAYEVVAAAASSSCSYRRYELVLVREIPPCSGSRRWRYPMACTIHNSKKSFHKGGREVKTHACVREADPALPASHESPRPSQRVAIYLQFERYGEEVDSRGAGVHLLLVATKFWCSCSPPRGRHNLPRCSQSFTKCRVVRLAAMSISTSADNAYCPSG